MLSSHTERRGFPGGLRAQLLLGLLLLISVAFGLIAVATLQIVERSAWSAEAESTSLRAELLAARLTNTAEPTRDVAQAFVNRDGVLAAGRWSTDSFEGSGAHLEEFDTRIGEQIDEGAATHEVQIAGAPHLLATVPLESGRTHAVVLVSMDLVDARVQRARKLLLFYLGIDALFIIIVGYAFFTFLIVRPIRAIGVATKRAAKGDLASPISVRPPNELGQVGRSFNDMLEELRSKREELEERLEELNQTNRELSQTQDSLIRSEKLASVGQLSAGVAHEIGNPLAAIAGYVEIMEDELDDEMREDILERTGREVERIRTIIRDLLDFSREDREQAVSDVQLRECIAEAQNLVEAQPQARDVDFAVELPPAELRVRAVASQLVQVLVNLLINAVDAIDGDGRVELVTVSREDSVVISVCDDGPGVEQDDVQRLFEPFYTTKDPGEGTGLGLAISLRIIKRFDGDIEVDSEPGDGTCFRIRLKHASPAE